MHIIVVKYLYTLQNGRHDKSRYHPSAYEVSAMYSLCCVLCPCGLFITGSLYLWIPSAISPSPKAPLLPLSNHQSVYVFEVLFCFIHINF